MLYAFEGRVLLFLAAHGGQCGHLDEPKNVWFLTSTKEALEPTEKQRRGVFNLLNRHKIIDFQIF